jgi:hypothetical protein
MTQNYAAQRAALASQLTPQQVMILDAFQSQVYIQGQMDIQHEPLYDTVTLAAGAQVTALSTAFFTNVGPASGKTLAQTNLTQSRRLPAPEAFSAFAIRLAWEENIVLADILAILWGFAFQLFLGQKAYNTGPLWHYNAGGGLNAFTIAAIPAIALYTNGVPGRDHMHRLAIPIVIENQMEFYAQLTGNAYTLVAAGGQTLGTGLALMCLLDGLHARGIQ